MSPDAELLRQFARTHSEAAFGELVRRHVNLVYSTALRLVGGDAHLAQDVAQTVFADLAHKAGSLAGRETLTGWLYTSTHFAAAKIVRSEYRRRNREEQFMRDQTTEAAPEPDWENIRPVLDDTMHELKETDREAILLRYFENQPFIQVGAKLGLNENAARMRVERALEKLRAIFAERGITTAGALASVISANAVQLAPANLAATLTTASLAAAGTGTFTIMKILTATKLKLAFGAIVVAGAATVFVVQQQNQTRLRGENESLQQQLARLQTDDQSLSNRLADAGETKKLSDEQFNELLKLRGEVGVLGRQADEAKQQADAANQKSKMAEDKLATALSVQAKFTKQETETVNNTKMLGLAERLYAGDNNGVYATNFEQMTNELGPLYKNPNLWDIEFVNAGIVTEHFPQMVMFRQRIAQQAPDGTWHRIYGFADGSVQIAISYDGNFDAWEKANTTLPPPQNPNQ